MSKHELFLLLAWFTTLTALLAAIYLLRDARIEKDRAQQLITPSAATGSATRESSRTTNPYGLQVPPPPF